jgi:hypothetical protein
MVAVKPPRRIFLNAALEGLLNVQDGTHIWIRNSLRYLVLVPEMIKKLVGKLLVIRTKLFALQDTVASRRTSRLPMKLTNRHQTLARLADNRSRKMSRVWCIVHLPFQIPLQTTKCMKSAHSRPNIDHVTEAAHRHFMVISCLHNFNDTLATSMSRFVLFRWRAGGFGT